MANSDCELVFYGQIAEHFLLDEVKKNVAELFKAGTDQIERMFTGRRVVIRNKLDLETAQKYVAALRKRGAICQIEKMGSPGEIVKPAETQKTEPPAPVPSAPASAPPEPVTNTENNAYTVSEVKRAEPGRPEAMPLAGEKADEILANTHFNLDPVGVKLSEEHIVEAPEFPGLDKLTLAPVGSDMAEPKEALPQVEPDTSYLELAPLPDSTS